jgi:hypothetical protein
MADDKHPEVLVSTDWVEKHVNDPTVRLVEVDVDTARTGRGIFLGQWAGIGRRDCRTTSGET